jgi:hypothetical protein
MIYTASLAQIPISRQFITNKPDQLAIAKENIFKERVIIKTPLD